jgi:release factor glutamine methyltransferase
MVSDARGTTLQDLVRSVAGELGSVTEARWIVAHAAGIASDDLVGRLSEHAAPSVEDALGVLMRRRSAGEPLQYVLGTWAFRTIEITVDPRVLVPRPETEQVVGVALEELAVQASTPLVGDEVIVVDLGTGSGAIALALAAEGRATVGSTRRSNGGPRGSPRLEVWATDCSPAALDVARSNLADLEQRMPSMAGIVRFAGGTWFDALPQDLVGHIHLAVSNPPYVSAREWEGLDSVVQRFEPKDALVAGPRGTEALEALLDGARSWLAPGGSVVLELAPHQADRMVRLASAFGYEDPQVRADLASRPRTLVARRPRA